MRFIDARHMIIYTTSQMGLYADSERGRYPVWQSLDHVNFLLGSRILFVTVTVCSLHLSSCTKILIVPQ